MSPPLLLLLLLFVICPSSMAAASSSSSSSSSSTTISLPLHRHLPSSSSSSSSSSSLSLPLLLLSSASLRRASHLKSPKPTPPSSFSSSVPLFPHSYGGYSLPVSFGSPPQPLPLFLDSASPLPWLPCTHSYRCLRCGSTSSPVPTFLPKSSFSSRLISCSNPSCLWIHSPRLLSRCRNSSSSSSSSHAAKLQVCPPYLILYGTGSTAGLLLAETLALPSRSVPGFVVGCSVFSDRQPPTGLAAFGRGSPSFPAQLGLKRFSYCLLSRRFDDDAAVSGSLILGGEDDGGLSFVPLLSNPSPFPAYYYVGLRRIIVGGRRVRLPRRALVPDPSGSGSGSGGAIVDSGTTFTYLHPAAFAPLAAALLDHVAGRLNRSAAAERRAGLRPCFALPPSPPSSPEAATVLGLPELALHFNGGAEMRLPVKNCFVLAGPTAAAAETVCLAVVSGDDGGGAGPWIILGSFQQQNYYMVYDLEKNRLGFRPQSCTGAERGIN